MKLSFRFASLRVADEINADSRTRFGAFITEDAASSPDGNREIKRLKDCRFFASPITHCRQSSREGRSSMRANQSEEILR